MAEPITAQGDTHSSDIRIGVVLGITSSLGYAASNLALREVAVPNDFGWAVWVTAMKAIPAAVVAWVLIAMRMRQGLPSLPPGNLVWKLILAGILMQYGGNLCFQLALTLGGLAISVPLCFAVLILTGAWLGHVFLGDVVSRRMYGAIAVLGVSILFLSAGADAAATSMHEEATTLTMIAAIAAASFSGFAYGTCGVIIRRLTQNMSLSASLVIFSTVGVVTLTAHALMLEDSSRILADTRDNWFPLLASGVFNAIAFFAVAGALRRVSVTFLNLLNSMQNALCALAGVLLFAEPLTTSLKIGCGLTIAGILLVDGGGRPNDKSPDDQGS